MPREYVKITIYRQGTLDNPTDPYVIEEDYSAITIDNTMSIASLYEIKLLNFHNEHTDQFGNGDIIEIDIGSAPNHEVTLGGLIFAVDFQEDYISIIGFDWTHFLVGPRVVAKYSNLDYGDILRNVSAVYVPSLKSNFLFDTGYILQDVYPGGYNTAIDVYNDLTGRIGFDFKVRPDREIIIFPDGLQVDFIDGFNEELDDVDPDGWTEVSQTWYVSDNTYMGLASGGTNGITLTDITTSNRQEIRLIINGHTDGASDNGFVIFDYQSSSDFKFAGLDFDNDYWYIGHYDGSWNYDAQDSESLDIGTDYRVRIVIEGNEVTIYEWDVENEQWLSKTNYTFGSIGTGTIGLVVRAAKSFFDDFVIYSAGLESINVDDDCLGWTIAKRDFRDLVNRVTVIGGKEAFEDDFSSGSLWAWGDFYDSGSGGTATIVDEALQLDTSADQTVRQWTQAKYKNFDFICNMKSIDKGGGWINTPSLLVRGTDESNFYRVQMNCDSDYLEIFKIVAGTPTSLKQISYTFDVDTYYVIAVKCTGENIKVYVNGVNEMDFSDTTFGSGFNGLEVIDGKSEIDDLKILTDRDVIATASDPALISKWGEKSSDPIRDESIRTKDEALNKALNILRKHRVEKTRGILKNDGDVRIQVGDVIDLTAPDCAITNVEYRIFSVVHLIDEREGYVTLLKVAEYIPGLEEIIRMISIRETHLAWVGILSSVLISSLTDTVYTPTDSVDLIDVPYYNFYFDEEDTWGYSYWDFASFN